MKKIFFIIGLLFLFIGLNYNGVIHSYYSFLGQYENIDTPEGKYNYGNILYNSGFFDRAMQSYSGITDENNSEVVFRTFANTGNSLYRLGELDNKIPINLWEQSIQNYKQALQIEKNNEIEKNLEFVKNKIKQIQKEEENQENKNGENTPPDSQEENNNDSQNPESGQDGGKSENPQDKGEEQDTGNNEGQGESKLSEQTKKILEQKAQELKSAQGNYGQFYNKVYQDNSKSNTLFDAIFSNDPSFDNSLLDKNKEKDW